MLTISKSVGVCRAVFVHLCVLCFSVLFFMFLWPCNAATRGLQRLATRVHAAVCVCVCVQVFVCVYYIFDVCVVIYWVYFSVSFYFLGETSNQLVWPERDIELC